MCDTDIHKCDICSEEAAKFEPGESKCIVGDDGDDDDVDDGDNGDDDDSDNGDNDDSDDGDDGGLSAGAIVGELKLFAFSKSLLHDLSKTNVSTNNH